MAASLLVPSVRLLTPLPRLEGPTGPGMKHQARRAVELVAYLALHHPQPVSAERLRTRVLSSAGQDASAKTLFNVVNQARRALGNGPEGGPLLPRCDATGLYHLSPAVAVDARLALDQASLGDRAPQDAQAMVHYRRSLAWVEGEPLCGVRRGYGWWTVEGHQPQIARALVGVACRLSALALGVGRSDLARWALTKGRAVEPESEALCRAAMEVAAAEGDADELRRSWRDCRHRLQGDDPALAMAPSRATEVLFRTLSATLVGRGLGR